MDATNAKESRLAVHSKTATDKAVDGLLGEELSPELRDAAKKAASPWVEKAVRWLDDAIKIPGTNIGIGLDPIIGFVLPGAGDAITGTGSMGLLLLALKERVPTIVLLRMCLNILVDTVGGVLPVIGDAFDLVWRSNRRNLELIELYRDDPKAEPSFVDYALVALGFGLAIVSIILPIVLVYGIGLTALIGLFKQLFG